MSPKKIILFDFDGVIADSFDLAFKVNSAVAPEIATKKDFQDLFNGNINDWATAKHRSAEERARVKDDFMRQYLPQLKNVKVFPGMKKVVSDLARRYNLFIISSTIKSPLCDFLNRNNLLLYFQSIIGNDFVDPNKTDRIKAVFKDCKAGPSDCVFITDTFGDMKEAASLGVRSIAVSWGFQEKESLLKGKPFAIAQRPEDLLGIVSSYFNGE